MSVGFTLAQDSVTQEFNETITLILSPNFGSFDFIGPNDELCDQLNVTIIDMDGKLVSQTSSFKPQYNFFYDAIFYYC